MSTPDAPVPTAYGADPAGVAAGTGDVARGLLAPSTLRPVELDLGTVFWVITGCFAAAFVVAAAIGLAGSVEGRTVAICATGVGLGILAQGWLRWRNASLRRRSAAGGAGADPTA